MELHRAIPLNHPVLSKGLVEGILSFLLIGYAFVSWVPTCFSPKKGAYPLFKAFFRNHALVLNGAAYFFFKPILDFA